MKWKVLSLLTLLFQMVFVSAAEPSWDIYSKLLTEYVKTSTHQGTTLSWVNYSKLKNDQGFTQVVNKIENFSLNDLKTKEERLAFYINAYNILAIKTVIDNWPVKSIKDVGSLFKSVWKKDAGKIGGKTVTLNEIEHQILRPMGDPRIHMAIVCASVSCPDLRTEPYTAENLNKQLNEQSRFFLSNPQKGLRIEGNKVRTSRIFEWFKEDFHTDGGVEVFIRQYSELPSEVNLKANLPYDWTVNGE